MIDSLLANVFTGAAVRRLRQYQTRIEACLDRLTPEQVWMRDAETQNAVGNLVLHLCGNVRQWIVAGVGGAADTRNRDGEFAARGGAPIDDLKRGLAATVSEAAEVIESLGEARLGERLHVQNYDVTVLEGVFHVVQHFAEHTGQIIYATKLFTREDLGFYAHLKRAHAEKTP